MLDSTFKVNKSFKKKKELMNTSLNYIKGIKYLKTEF